MEERQVRSYQKAFTGESVIYSFGETLGGNAWHAWRPVPVRYIGWTAALEVLTFIALHLVGADFRLFSLAWITCYLVFPLGFGWVLTVGKVEGRRIHVALVAWIGHFVRGRNLVGGCVALRKLEQPKTFSVSIVQGSRARRGVRVPKLAKLAGLQLAMPRFVVGSSLTAAVLIIAGLSMGNLLSNPPAHRTAATAPHFIPITPQHHLSVTPGVRAVPHIISQKHPVIHHTMPRRSQPTIAIRAVPHRISVSHHQAAAPVIIHAAIETAPVVSNPPVAHHIATQVPRASVSVPRPIPAPVLTPKPIAIPETAKPVYVAPSSPSKPSCFPGVLGC
jgi:hypothetical protein